MKKFNDFKKMVADLEGDADKFYNKGNSAAGTRVRKGMQDLKNLAQAIRLEVQERKNSVQHGFKALAALSELQQQPIVFFHAISPTPIQFCNATLIQ